jgi:MFS family permease
MVSASVWRDDVTRLLLHFGLFNLAVAFSGVFSAAFLLREGLPPAAVFLVLGATIALRFAFRPLVLVIAPRIGARQTLMLGTAISAPQYLLLACVTGLDGWLIAYIVVAAVGEALYWTSFHACFAVAGDGARMGRRASLRQIVAGLTGILGPPIGGLVMAHHPWAAFAASAALRLLATWPLATLPRVPVARRPPPDAWRNARFGMAVFATDAWIVCCAGTAWALIAFQALDRRFDTLGVAMAAAALVGAVATWLLGRHIDFGHGWRAVLINLAAGLAILTMQASAGYAPLPVIGAMLAAAVLGGIAVPAIMTAVYAEARAASCAVRFQFAAEGGWDAGGVAACLVCAGALWLGASLQALVALAAPACIVQALLMRGVYERQDRLQKDRAGAATPA